VEVAILQSVNQVARVRRRRLLWGLAQIKCSPIDTPQLVSYASQPRIALTARNGSAFELWCPFA
jgi:hypothetical protein